MVHCRDIFAPIGEQVCDGSYIAFVMKEVNGPTQAKTRLEWATRPSFSRSLRKGWAMGIVGALYGRGAAGVSERSRAVGAESHPSKNEGLIG
jgi:hypothetical protein